MTLLSKYLKVRVPPEEHPPALEGNTNRGECLGLWEKASSPVSMESEPSLKEWGEKSNKKAGGRGTTVAGVPAGFPGPPFLTPGVAIPAPP